MNILNYITGRKVIGLKGTDYEGLVGAVERVLEQGETEQPFEIGIVVTFEEPEHSTVEYTHPHLNGTSIEEVIFIDEDIQKELAFYEEEDDEFSYTLDGKAVCPNCYRPIELVFETQYTDLSWKWNAEEKQYIKSHDTGDSDGKKCPDCDGRIEDEQEVFAY